MRSDSFLFLLVSFLLIYYFVRHNLKLNEKFIDNTNTKELQQQSASNTQQSASNTQQSASNTQQSASNTQQSTSNTQQSVSNTQQSASNTQQSASNTQQSASNTQQSASNTQQSTSNTQQSVSNTQQSASNTQQSASNTTTIVIEDKKQKPKVKKDKTPEQNGIIFGYLPEETQETLENLKYNTDAIYHNTDILFNYKNYYLGMSNKNPLLPVFLEKLGTFAPYQYDSITILKKSNDKPDEPIFYNKTTIYFQIKYLQDFYYLQFIPKNNTFYLSNNPSYFILLNAIDMNSTKEVKVNDSILVQCLDNGEYLLEYDTFLITEKDKSSTFFLKRSETIDICSNFNLKDNIKKEEYLKQFMTKNEADAIRNNANIEINRYISKLKTENEKKIKDLDIQIQILEKKKSNLDSKNSIDSQKKKNDIDSKLKVEKEKLENELNQYQQLLEKEYTDFKNKLPETRGNYWLNEINNLRKEVCSK